jgi:hypothetical protein
MKNKITCLLCFLVLVVPGVATSQGQTPAAKKVTASKPNTLSSAEKKAGWKLLFDGKTTAGWRGFKRQDFPKDKWTVEEGCLKHLAKAPNSASGSVDIITVEQFDDFDFQFEWRISPGGNSGVKYLVTEEREGPVAHEYQVLDDERHPDAGIGAHRRVAAFYDVLPPNSNKVLRPVGEFNLSRILVEGNHVEHWLNGAKVLEYELDSEAIKAAIAKSKFKNVAGFEKKIKGPLLLQDHGDEVCFRNLKIRQLLPR